MSIFYYIERTLTSNDKNYKYCIYFHYLNPFNHSLPVVITIIFKITMRNRKIEKHAKS